MSEMRAPFWADVLTRLAFGPLLSPQAALGQEPAPDAPEYTPAAWAGLRAMADYIQHFLTAPHPDLGRSGAVCPFAARAIEGRAISLTAFLPQTADEAEVMAGMRQLRAVLNADLQAAAPEHRNRAIVAVFPQLREPRGAALIERVQKALKPSFVESGLMIGEFYPACAKGGLWNDGFKALQAPVISLAVRNITVYDAPFMLGRTRYVEAFVRRFGVAGAERIEKARQARAAARLCPRPSPGDRDGARP